MRKLMFILILLVVVGTLSAQSILPEWSQLSLRLWAHNEWSLCNAIDPFSCGGVVLMDNRSRLDAALLELRDSNPELFDSIFRAHRLAIDTR